MTARSGAKDHNPGSRASVRQKARPDPVRIFVPPPMRKESKTSIPDNLERCSSIFPDRFGKGGARHPSSGRARKEALFQDESLKMQFAFQVYPETTRHRRPERRHRENALSEWLGSASGRFLPYVFDESIETVRRGV